MLIKLIRHGESISNVGTVKPNEVGDHSICLTANGHEQARSAGRALGAEFICKSLVYRSPYCRTRETLAGILEGAGLGTESVRVFEDPRLREVDTGYASWDEQQELRKIHGWFYYRYKGGESPADCYDRTSAFLESLMRQANRKKIETAVIVTHGLTLRCFVMRFLHLTVEQFSMMETPMNCDIVTLGYKQAMQSPLFTSGRWGVEGLRMRQ